MTSFFFDVYGITNWSKHLQFLLCGRLWLNMKTRIRNLANSLRNKSLGSRVKARSKTSIKIV